MKSLKKIRSAVACLAGMLVVSGTAFAMSSGAGHEEFTFMTDWLPRLVNFSIIAVVVVYFGRKPIRDFFKNRSVEIARAMQESQEAREKAVADLAEMERKIKELEVETNKMIADAKARGEKDKQALLDEGKKLVEDIQHQVKQGIDMELRKAKSALATEASLLSLELAENKIKDNISAKDQQRIVKEYISSVGGKA
jgi:F-type H+-transporting ATPase subunit b